jgi:hypothetical protein
VKSRLRRAAMQQEGSAATASGARAASRAASAGASAATPPPANEPLANGQTARSETMAAQSPGQVQQETFLQMVERQLDQMPMPQTAEQMDRFRESGGASGLREQVQGQAQSQAAQAQAGIQDAATTPAAPVPSPAAAPLPPQPGAPPPAAVQPAEGLPTPRPDGEVSLEESRQRVAADMDREHLTEERIQEANDPRFSSVLTARNAVNEQASRAPAEYRAQESDRLRTDTQRVNADTTASLTGMRATRTRSNSAVSAQQRAQMAQEAAERRAVSDHIRGLFTATQSAVQDKLAWLEAQVDERFGAAEARAKSTFEDHVASSMRSWKLRRYGSRLAIPLVGALVAAGTWAYDKLRGIDHFPEIQGFYAQGKQKYVGVLREAIRDIAGLVESTLRWCQTRIQQGRDDIRGYVAGLRDDLRATGEEAATSVNDQLDQLRQTVEDSRKELAGKLVDRYRQSMQALDQRVEQMRAENRGLVAKFVSAIKEAWEILKNFRRQVMSLLSEVADVVERIVEHPVRFIKNLVRALRQGFDQFKDHIWTHLREGLVSWLFGALDAAGIRLPTSFDIRSIIAFVLELLGITVPRLRAKVARIIGERNMAILEKIWGYVVVLVREGPIGLWEHIKDDLSSLWDQALEAVKGWAVTRIVQSAVAKLVSMFNPAGAIIQAAIAIYNAVMFFIERINQIMELVRTIVRALDKIERGDIAEAADWVERSMARAIPVIISFLARLLGLGGISDTVRGFIERIQTRVDRIIDRVLDKIVATFRKLVGGGAELTPEQKLDQALAAAEQATSRLSGAWTLVILRPIMAGIRLRFGLKELEVSREGDHWVVEGAINPRRKKQLKGPSAPTNVKTKLQQTSAASAPHVGKSLEVKADPLTHKHDAGSQPPRGNRGFPLGWNLIPIPEASRFWDRHHLLSEHFGGPGNQEWNILPTKRPMNQKFRDGPEKWAKENILKILSKVGWYKVKIKYDNAYPGIPSHLHVTAGFHKEDPAQASGYKADYTVVHDSPLTHTDRPAVATPPKLHSSSRDELQSAGIPQNAAQWFARASTRTDPRFNTWAKTRAYLSNGAAPADSYERSARNNLATVAALLASGDITWK